MSRVVNRANLKDETAEEKKILSCLLLNISLFSFSVHKESRLCIQWLCLFTQRATKVH